MFQPGGSIWGVLFDAVGTLIRPNPPVAEAYLTAARRFGVDGGLTEAEVDRRFRAAFARQEAIDREAGWRTDEIREFRRWELIVEEMFGEASKRTGLFEELWNHFADAKNWAVNEPIRAMMASAYRRGPFVGVASNFDARLHRVLSGIEGIGLGTDVFVSSELGQRKPSVEFFRAIEQRLTCPPQYLLLIGDDAVNDYAAAKAAGWSAIQFDGNNDELISQLSQLRFDLGSVAVT
jgi:putative hydrolase of the HAD superfamily